MGLTPTRLIGVLIVAAAMIGVQPSVADMYSCPMALDCEESGATMCVGPTGNMHAMGVCDIGFACAATAAGSFKGCVNGDVSGPIFPDARVEVCMESNVAVAAIGVRPVALNGYHIQAATCRWDGSLCTQNDDSGAIIGPSLGWVVKAVGHAGKEWCAHADAEVQGTIGLVSAMSHACRYESRQNLRIVGTADQFPPAMFETFVSAMTESAMTGVKDAWPAKLITDEVRSVVEDQVRISLLGASVHG